MNVRKEQNSEITSHVQHIFQTNYITNPVCLYLFVCVLMCMFVFVCVCEEDEEITNSQSGICIETFLLLCVPACINLFKSPCFLLFMEILLLFSRAITSKKALGDPY